MIHGKLHLISRQMFKKRANQPHTLPAMIAKNNMNAFEVACVVSLHINKLS